MIRAFLSFIGALFAANTVLAQEIAVMPPDPAVKNGVFPNGMSWYVVENPNVRNMADFVLVQHVGSGTIPGAERDSIVALSRRILASRPASLRSSVQDYFAGKGCIPGPEGFAEVREDATVFRFDKVNLGQSATALDSTLFVLMNMAGVTRAEAGPELCRWYAPSDQAVIVSGDVDAGKVEEKLRMLSYMLPAENSLPRREYAWTDRDGAEVELEHGRNPDVAKVSLVWRLPRTPRHLMNTVMPAIYEKYMTMLGYVAEDRISGLFRRNSVPATSISGTYFGGTDKLGDEEFAVSVSVSPEDIGQAVSVLAGVMSGIDASGAGIREVRNAGRRYSDVLYSADKGGNIRNREYVDRCICAFIYNSPLASRKDIRKFHSSHVLPDSTECSLFHSIASASIDRDRNVSLHVRAQAQPFGEDELKRMFVSAWNVGSCDVPAEIPAVSYEQMPLTKVKVRSVRKEYLSGGSVWTLSNGIRVMVKDMPSEDGMVHYSLSLNGGTGSVDGLCSGQGSSLADFFTLSNVGGVPWKIFKDDARRHGMTLDCRVGHSVTEFKGMLPAGRLDYLFKALRTMMNTRQTDMDEWNYYLKTEPLRQAVSTTEGCGASLAEDFAGKADRFFQGLGGSINNGIIVLVGKIDEKELREVLTTQAAGFVTSERAFARAEVSGACRDKAEYHAQRDRKDIEMLLTAPLSLTAENYYTAAVAVMALRHELAVAAAGKGMAVSVSHEFKLYPQETFVLRVSVSEVAASGLARGTSGYSRNDAASAVRTVLSDLSAVQVSEEYLASCRYRLEKYLLLEKERPEYWINALNLRYLAGKDFTTGAEDRIRNVDMDDIRRLLTTVGGSRRVEYVIDD